MSTRQNRIYRKGVEDNVSDCPKRDNGSSGIENLPEGDLSEEAVINGNKDLYRAFVQLTAEGIWRIELDHPIDLRLPIEEQLTKLLQATYVGECNPAYAQMKGFASPEDVHNQRFSDLIHADRPAVQEFFRKIIRANYRLTFIETKEEDKQGNPHWFLQNYYGIVENGCLVRAWGTLQDITARKRNEAIQAALYKISQATNTTQNLYELYHSIHETLSELMFARNFFIALYDPLTDTMSFPYFVDEVDDPPTPHHAGHGLTEYVLRTGRSLLAGPEEFKRLMEAGEVEAIGADSIDWLGVPLMVDNKPIGVLAVQSYTEGIRFGEVERDILMFVSTQVAMAIDRKRAVETLRINEARFRAVVEDQTELIARFRPGDFQLTFVNDAYCRYFNKTREELLGTSILPRVPAIHRPVLLTVLASLTPERPVVTTENPGAGALGEGSWEQWSNRAIFDETGRLIEYQSVGRDITDRKRAEDELRYLSTHDRLTGIYNRAYFEEELSRLQHGRQFPVSVVMADVDGLKEVNDTYGHVMGDELLRTAADVIKSAFRAQDVVARIGGDEFGVLLPGSDPDVARDSLDRIRRNLEIFNTNRKIPARLSLGFATANRGADLADAYKLADRMMYQEKFQVRARRVQETLMGLKRGLGDIGSTDASDLSR